MEEHTQLIKEWKACLAEWPRASVHTAREVVAERVSNMIAQYDVAPAESEEKSVSRNTTVAKLVKKTMELAQSDFQLGRLQNISFSAEWHAVAHLMRKVWLLHGYEWCHDKQKRTLPVVLRKEEVNPSVLEKNSDTKDDEDIRMYVSTTLTTTLFVAISFIEAFVSGSTLLQAEDKTNAYTYPTGKHVENYVYQIASEWHRTPADVDLYLENDQTAHGKMLERVESAIAHWCWVIPNMSTRVVDTDPCAVGTGIRGVRPVNEAVLIALHMNKAVDLIYGEHEIGMADAVVKFPDDIMPVWDLFLKQQYGVQLNNKQAVQIRANYFLSQSMVAARSIYGTRASQSEYTVDGYACSTSVHEQRGLPWFKERMAELKSVHAAFKNKAQHPVRAFAALMLVDRVFKSWLARSFMESYVVFEWDLFRRLPTIYQKERNFAERRPLIIFVLGRYWVQLHQLTGVANESPILLACDNGEQAILLWMYFVLSEFGGLLEDEGDIASCSEFAFLPLLQRFVEEVRQARAEVGDPNAE